MKNPRILRLGWALALAWALSTANARACEVCYGAAESPMLEGMSMSVVFMLATTYFVLIGMGLTFFITRRRARSLQSAAAAKGERT